MGISKMSNLIASVKKIDSESNLNIVTFDFYGTSLKMMSLELSEDICIDAKVILCIKPFSVAVAKNLKGELSYSNQIKTKVASIEVGKLLCNLKLSVEDSYIESIITVESLKRIDIKIGDDVLALVKANEISIVDVVT